MAGEDQERVEDYLELEHYIEELQAGQVAHLPYELTSSQASVYRMAALFRSASPEEGEPRPEFVAGLKERLEQALLQPTKPPLLPFLASKLPGTSQNGTRPTQYRLNFSRRALLMGGAAASLVVGAGIGASIQKVQQGKKLNTGSTASSGTPKWSDSLVNEGEGTWHFVAMLADLGDSPVRFATDTIIGYVIRNDGDGGTPEPVVAVSAACTHMGCIVQWQVSDHKFHCPCHGGLFAEYGKVDNSSPIRYLAPLPRLRAMVDKTGKVFVEVPKSQQSQKMTSWVESK